jgi:hypothetical protein
MSIELTPEGRRAALCSIVGQVVDTAYTRLKINVDLTEAEARHQDRVRQLIRASIAVRDLVWANDSMRISDTSPGWISVQRYAGDDSRRVRYRPSRFLSAVVAPTAAPGIFPPDIIGDWSLVFSSLTDGVGSADVELLSGDAIVEAYRNEIGGHSCMTDECCDLVTLYANISDRGGCRLAVVRHGDQTARALLWETDKGLLVDRIYPPRNSSVPSAMLESWALANRYWIKEGDFAGGGTFSRATATGKLLQADTFSVALRDGDLPDDCQLPYVDSLRYLIGHKRALGGYDVSAARLSTSTARAPGLMCVTLDSTEGGPLRPSNECSNCGDRCRGDDAVMYDGEVWCAVCHARAHPECQRCGCDVDTDEGHDDGDGWYCPDCARAADYETCDECGRWVDSDDLVTVGHQSVCQTCVPAATAAMTWCDDLRPMMEFRRAHFGYTNGCDCESCERQAFAVLLRCERCLGLVTGAAVGAIDSWSSDVVCWDCRLYLGAQRNTLSAWPRNEQQEGADNGLL